MEHHDTAHRQSAQAGNLVAECEMGRGHRQSRTACINLLGSHQELSVHRADMRPAEIFSAATWLASRQDRRRASMTP